MCLKDKVEIKIRNGQDKSSPQQCKKIGLSSCYSYSLHMVALAMRWHSLNFFYKSHFPGAEQEYGRGVFHNNVPSIHIVYNVVSSIHIDNNNVSSIHIDSSYFNNLPFTLPGQQWASCLSVFLCLKEEQKEFWLIFLEFSILLISQKYSFNAMAGWVRDGQLLWAWQC